MTALNILLAVRLTFGIVEIILFQVGAIILGFSIHFFLKNRNSAFTTTPHPGNLQDADQLRLQFYEELDKLRGEIQQLENDNTALKQEKSRVARRVLELEDEIEQSAQEREDELKRMGEEDYLVSLSHTHERLIEQNKLVQALLKKIEILKSHESELAEYKRLNQQYQVENNKLASLLTEKDILITELNNQVAVLSEVKQRLESTYHEFDSLQLKLQSVQSQLTNPSARTFEFTELQQSYFRLTKDFDELKLKNLSLLEENQGLKRDMNDVDEKLRESNFQRQQLMRKICFLEELNGNLSHLAGHQRTLEGSLKRLGELEAVMVRTGKDIG